MAYVEFQLSVVVADDSNKSGKSFDRQAFIYQTLDRESVTPTVLVSPGAAEAQVSLGSVTTGKRLIVMSDYPVLVRANGPSATQYTMNRGNVQATNSGAPYPPMCFWGGTVDVTSLYLAPITNAERIATCWVMVAGDPLNNY